ncbi:MAG: pirin family protein [Myxococcota bacterium]
MARMLTRRRTLSMGAAGLGSLWVPGCGRRAYEPTPDVDVATAAVQAKIHANPTTDGDGATLARVFPSPQLRNLDPFVLLDDFDVRAPAGFPTHPHRGFEAFTYMVDGAFEHRDTMGNISSIASGGTQRFNSGRGAKHSEMPGSDGSNRGLQLWVNLPKRLKRMEPEYEGMDAEALPMQRSGAETTRIIAGGDSPVGLHTEVDYRDVTLLADRWSVDVPQGRNTLLYVIDGTLTLGAHTARRGEALLVDAGRLQVAGTKGTRFAYLSGAPHGEPIRHRGPFVD